MSTKPPLFILLCAGAVCCLEMGFRQQVCWCQRYCLGISLKTKRLLWCQIRWSMWGVNEPWSGPLGHFCPAATTRTTTAMLCTEVQRHLNPSETGFIFFFGRTPVLKAKCWCFYLYPLNTRMLKFEGQVWAVDMWSYSWNSKMMWNRLRTSTVGHFAAESLCNNGGR